MFNLLNLKLSYKRWQEACDTLCDTFLRLGILGILPLKSHPQYLSQSHDFKKGAKGSVVVCCFFDCANNLAFIAQKAHDLTLLH